jgi:hypothetical protein
MAVWSNPNPYHQLGYTKVRSHLLKCVSNHKVPDVSSVFPTGSTTIYLQEDRGLIIVIYNWVLNTISLSFRELQCPEDLRHYCIYPYHLYLGWDFCIQFRPGRCIINGPLPSAIAPPVWLLIFRCFGFHCFHLHFCSCLQSLPHSLLKWECYTLLKERRQDQWDCLWIPFAGGTFILDIIIRIIQSIILFIVSLVSLWIKQVSFGQGNGCVQ